LNERSGTNRICLSKGEPLRILRERSPGPTKQAVQANIPSKGQVGGLRREREHEIRRAHSSSYDPILSSILDPECVRHIKDLRYAQ
jgi:hypothetical protein